MPCLWYHGCVWRGTVPKMHMGSWSWELFDFHIWKNDTPFNVRVRLFCMEFQNVFWNFTQNILPIHWKISFLYNVKILRALRFYFLDYDLVTPYGERFSSTLAQVPDGTKPLPKPILTYHLWHIPDGSFTGKTRRYLSLIWVWKLLI